MASDSRALQLLPQSGNGLKKETSFEHLEIEEQNKRNEDGRMVKPDFRSCLFPLEVLCCLPENIRDMIPTPFHLFQSFTHLLLMFGVISAVYLVGHAFKEIYRWYKCPPHDEHPHCHMGKTEWIENACCILLITPCMIYFVKTIMQFDDDLIRKKQAAEAARKALMDQFRTTLGDMNDILEKATETNTGFAESAFEGKKKDFTRFLERIENRFCGDEATDLPEDEQKKLDEELAKFLPQFKEFCKSWFRIFEECYIQHQTVVSEEEVDNCQTIKELCELCKMRLKKKTLNFIGSQQRQDATDISAAMANVQNMSERGKNMLEMDADVRKNSTRAGGRGATRGLRKMKEKNGKVVRFFLGMSWMRFGLHRFRCARNQDSKDGFPLKIGLGCIACYLLSPEHVTLITGMFVNIALILLEWKDTWKEKGYEGTNKADRRFFVGLFANLFCLCLTLLNFEAIDTIAQLIRETEQVKKETDKVEARREEMTQFWGQAQQQTDLWLNRTLPRLELYGEIHQKIEDIPEAEQVRKAIMVTNNKWAKLESHIGTREAWVEDGKMPIEKKKKFCEAVTALCSELDIDGVLKKFDKLTHEVEGLELEDYDSHKTLIVEVGGN